MLASMHQEPDQQAAALSVVVRMLKQQKARYLTCSLSKRRFLAWDRSGSASSSSVIVRLRSLLDRRPAANQHGFVLVISSVYAMSHYATMAALCIKSTELHAFMTHPVYALYRRGNTL